MSPHSPPLIRFFKEYANFPVPAWHAEQSIRLRQQANKFSLRISRPLRAAAKVWIHVFIVGRNWNKWGDLVWEDGLPALIRSPAPPPPLWGVSVMKSAAAPLRCAQPPLPADKSHISSGSFLSPPSPSPLESQRRRLPSSYRWFHRLVATLALLPCCLLTGTTPTPAPPPFSPLPAHNTTHKTAAWPLPLSLCWLAGRSNSTSRWRVGPHGNRRHDGWLFSCQREYFCCALLEWKKSNNNRKKRKKKKKWAVATATSRFWDVTAAFVTLAAEEVLWHLGKTHVFAVWRREAVFNKPAEPFGMLYTRQC